MREILFRGKRVDNGEWVYGYLVYGKDRTPYIAKNVETYNCDEEDDLYATSWFQTIPETIGEYTGLKDKNGKKIFEGDKVKAKFYGKDVNGEIGFNSGCFLLWNSCVSDNQLFIFTDIEVKGNIYDGDNK